MDTIFSNALIFRFLGKSNALIFPSYIPSITIRIGQTTLVIQYGKPRFDDIVASYVILRNN